MAFKRNRIRWDDALSRVDPTRFEALLANHYRRQGYRVEHVGAEAAGQRYDGGIDLKLFRDGAYVIVQCKRWNAYQVPHNDVHQLLGIMVNEGASGAILVTSGDFTRAATDAATKLGHVQLVDGVALRAMLDPLAVQDAARASDAEVGADASVTFRPRPDRNMSASGDALRLRITAIIGCALLFSGVLYMLGVFERSARPHATVARSVGPASAPTDVQRTYITRRPQQAGQPVNPYAVAGHVAGARVAALTGDTRAAEAHINAIANEVTRSARMPDVSRPIDREAARAAVRPLAGVRSAIWLDAANFVVMVDGAQHRTMDMIDRVCVALEPLGDTLAVVVNVQNVTAKSSDDATTLSRNCQLPEGQRALLQAKRQVDVVAPELREQFKRMQRR